MKERWNQLLCLLNQKLILFIGIGLGAVLFVMVFEPFQLDQPDFESRILFASGFGIIIFIIIFLLGIAYPSFANDNSQEEKYPELQHGIRNFLIWFLSSVSISFYLIFIRSISLTIYDVYKIVLICLLPPVIIGIYDKLLKLKEQNEKLALSGEILKKKIDDYNNDNANKSIYLSPENTPEKFSFLCPDILYIKSADNYAEIHFMDGEQLKKQLIRNTLKNIEQQLRKFPNFIRCHRICIVNVHKIEKLVGNCNNHSLIIKGTLEQIPVSRSYFLKIKEAL
jgi:hypothetical protein